MGLSQCLLTSGSTLSVLRRKGEVSRKVTFLKPCICSVGSFYCSFT